MNYKSQINTNNKVSKIRNGTRLAKALAKRELEIRNSPKEVYGTKN